MPSLLDAKLLVFDVYGTLVDWETGIYAAASPLLSRLPSPLSRSAFLQAFTARELAQQVLTPTLPYSALLAEVYTQLATSFALTLAEGEAEAFGKSVGRWQAFPDTVAALRKLKQHYKLVVLSNVDRASFSQTLRQHLGGDETFDLVVTAEDVGAYKPDLKGFEHVLAEAQRRWGIGSAQVCSTAQSLTHDHVPAKKLGLLSAWINRGGAVMGVGSDLDVKLDWTFKTLGEMADAVEAEAAKA